MAGAEPCSSDEDRFEAEDIPFSVRGTLRRRPRLALGLRSTSVVEE